MYLSESSWEALGYAHSAARRDNQDTDDLLIFVNETMRLGELSEEPIKMATAGDPLKDKPDPPPNQFTKFRRAANPGVRREDYEEDEAGRLHRNTRVILGEEFVADNVIPCYLIQVTLKNEYKEYI